MYGGRRNALSHAIERLRHKCSNPDVEITEVIFAWRAWWENCSLQGSLIFFWFKSFLRHVDIALDSERGIAFRNFRSHKALKAGSAVDEGCSTSLCGSWCVCAVNASNRAGKPGETPVGNIRAWSRGLCFIVQSASSSLSSYMSHSNSPASSSNFQLIINNALKEYEKRTKQDLLAHPLASQLQACDSPTAILNVLHQQVQGPDQARSNDDRWTKWLEPTVNILYALCDTLGEGVGLVSLMT